MDDCCAKKGLELEQVAQQKDQHRILTIVLILNAMMFLVEFVSGVMAGSAALMADATDMLGDALVYGLSLYALDRGLRWKAGPLPRVDRCGYWRALDLSASGANLHPQMAEGDFSRRNAEPPLSFLLPRFFPFHARRRDSRGGRDWQGLLGRDRHHRCGKLPRCGGRYPWSPGRAPPRGRGGRRVTTAFVDDSRNVRRAGP